MYCIVEPLVVGRRAACCGNSLLLTDTEAAISEAVGVVGRQQPGDVCGAELYDGA